MRPVGDFFFIQLSNTRGFFLYSTVKHPELFIFRRLLNILMIKHSLFFSPAVVLPVIFFRDKCHLRCKRIYTILNLYYTEFRQTPLFTVLPRLIIV